MNVLSEQALTGPVLTLKEYRDISAENLAHGLPDGQHGRRAPEDDLFRRQLVHAGRGSPDGAVRRQNLSLPSTCQSFLRASVLHTGNQSRVYLGMTIREVIFYCKLLIIGLLHLKAAR